MSNTPQDDNQVPIDRRKFIRVGSLGAAALAAGCAKVAPETVPAGAPAPVQTGQSPTAPVPPAQGQTASARPGQARPTRAAGPGFQRNFDPVPASEPAMNFAAFTDTHVGQATRSPNWDYAKHLDLLADDIMEQHASMRVRHPSGRWRVQHHGVRQRRRIARQSEIQLQEQLQRFPDESRERALSLCRGQHRPHGLQPQSRVCRGTKTIRSC